MSTLRSCIHALVITIFFLFGGGQRAMSADISPAEVQSLLGMKVPDDSQYRGPGWRYGSIGDVITGWACFGETRSGEFVVKPCYRRDGATAVVTMRHVMPPAPRFCYTIRSYSIVVDVLPMKSGVLRFPSEVHDKLQWHEKAIAENRSRRYTYADCDKDKSQGVSSAVVAITRPEPGREKCAHFTRQIKQAWQLDTQKQRMVPVSSKGIYCWWTACEDACQEEEECNDVD